MDAKELYEDGQRMIEQLAAKHNLSCEEAAKLICDAVRRTIWD